jgi:hypothetical protein
VLYEDHRYFAAPKTIDGRKLTLFNDTVGGMFIAETAVSGLGLVMQAQAQLDEGGVEMPPLTGDPFAPSGRGRERVTLPRVTRRRALPRRRFTRGYRPAPVGAERGSGGQEAGVRRQGSEVRRQGSWVFAGRLVVSCRLWRGAGPGAGCAGTTGG